MMSDEFTIETKRIDGRVNYTRSVCCGTCRHSGYEHYGLYGGNPQLQCGLSYNLHSYTYTSKTTKDYTKVCINDVCDSYLAKEIL